MKSQDLAGTQAIEQHQANHCKIAEGAEAVPERGHFVRDERNHNAAWLAQAQAMGHRAARAAIAGRGPLGVGLLKMRLASRDLAALVEAVQATHGNQPVIHGLRRGRRFAVELMPHVVEQSRFGDFLQRLGRLLEPAGEVQQIVGVSAQRTQR